LLQFIFQGAIDTMKVRYDKEIDAMYVYAEEGTPEYSEEVGEGVIIDVSIDGKVVGIEILDASEKFSPASLKKMLNARTEHSN
jgi:uncharacterized protein YuzE